MNWRKLFSRSRPVEVQIQPDIQFLGEQDWLPEKGLKGSWLPVLAERGSARAAYLAIISFDRGATYHPALCIRSATGDDPPLIHKLAAVFKQTFAQGQMVDMMFVTSEQEERLRKVCKPFYEVA